MKLSVLIPSEEYKGNAGARIRYGRITSHLADAGVSITLDDIAKFDARSADCDILLVSKCYDARSLLAAEIASRRGIRVGVDLFDDYFSQFEDSRLLRYRLWLRQMLARSDFSLCSTVSMRRRVAAYAPDCPVHVLNDPAPAIVEEQLSARLTEKLAETRADGRIRLAWFGIGDNPNFPVGISDIAAFAGNLREIETRGLPVELTILTNARALDARRLAMVADLPIGSVRVDEWSEAAEADLLDQSFACFLPVNAQSFSTAKSLNRAVTALTAGCQVLAAGYPLYQPLQSLIYAGPDDFISDLSTAQMRFSPSNMRSFRQAIEEFASRVTEADSLAAFLKRIPFKTAANDVPIHLIHGASTIALAHKSLEADGLSIATPFCRVPLGFDVVFENQLGGRLAMLVSDKALGKLKSDAREKAGPQRKIGDRNFWIIPVSDDDGTSAASIGENSVSLELALYSSTVRSMLSILTSCFEPNETIISENSSLPFSVN